MNLKDILHKLVDSVSVNATERGELHQAVDSHDAPPSPAEAGDPAE